MNMLNSYNFSTSPFSQPTRKLRRLENPILRTLRTQRLGKIYYRRNLIKKYSGKSEVKELDAETGLYYYGARYLDPRTSRWLSGDPAMAEYVPLAPINDDTRKHNSNLPGLGGVFNTINLHAYRYAGNNPIRYLDPNGRSDIENDSVKGEAQRILVTSYTVQITDTDDDGIFDLNKDNVEYSLSLSPVNPRLIERNFNEHINYYLENGYEIISENPHGSQENSITIINMYPIITANRLNSHNRQGGINVKVVRTYALNIMVVE
ncbi:MAG: RHS repeat-associated core domain-containing protein [Treponema sp.]|nr:RHS repeat-associated core domain-containing protein [Treponema sp.]